MSEASLGDLATELSSIADPHARSRARAFAAALLDLHGEAVARLLELIEAHTEDASAVLGAALADPLVSSLLVLHDLHPVPLGERVTQAVAEARRQLGPLGQGIGEPTIGDGVVTIRLEAAADSPQARIGIEAVLTRLLRTHAPDVEALALEGASSDARGGRALLPLAISTP